MFTKDNAQFPDIYLKLPLSIYNSNINLDCEISNRNEKIFIKKLANFVQVLVILKRNY
jgi:hypothetical protein